MKYTEIKNILSLATDPIEKLEIVMDLGKQIPDVPDDAVCTEIDGCSSHAEICRKDNTFYGKADSMLVKGIVAIITSMVDGKSPEEIKKMNLSEEFASLNLNLGTGRLAGVNSMIRFLQNL